MLPELLANMHSAETLERMILMLSLCSARIFAAFTLLPVVDDSILTGTTRNAVVMTMAVFVAWGQPIALANMDLVTLAGAMVKEGLIGVMFGFAASSVFWIAECAGALIDNQAGFNNVQQTNPLSGQQSTPMSNVLLQVSIAGFYMLGGMTVLTSLIFDSYGWWPIGKFLPDSGALLERFVQAQTSATIENTAKLAAPVMLVLLLIDIGIGLLGKAAEKLEPNSLAQPLKSATAVVMLSLLVALFFEQAKPALSLHGVRDEIVRWFPAAKPHN